MVHPDGFRPSFKLLNVHTPSNIWVLTSLNGCCMLSIIMNLVHENVVLVDLTRKHTFFDGDSDSLRILRQNWITIPGTDGPLFMLNLVGML